MCGGNYVVAIMWWQLCVVVIICGGNYVWWQLCVVVIMCGGNYILPNFVMAC